MSRRAVLLVILALACGAVASLAFEWHPSPRAGAHGERGETANAAPGAGTGAVASAPATGGENARRALPAAEPPDHAEGAPPSPPRPEGDEPVLLAGRVVEASGAAVAGARVRVWEHEPEEPGAFGARTMSLRERLTAVTGDDGRFEIHGRAQQPLLVRADKADRVLRQEVECTAPALDLLLVLDRAGSLVATLSPESAELAEIVHAQVRAPGTSFDVDGYADDATSLFEAVLTDVRAPNLELRRDGLRPGLCDVALIAVGNPRPLLVVPGVAVQAGSVTRDSRLQGIDLRPLAHALYVTVRLPDGRPGSGMTVYSYDGLSGIGERANDSGRARIITGRDGADIEVHEAGYRRARYDGVSQDLTIDLRAALRVELACAGADPASVAPATLCAFVEPVDPDPRDPRAARAQTVEFTGGARVGTLDVDAPGAYRVTWALAFPRSGAGWVMAHPEGVPPGFVQVADTAAPQRFAIGIDPQVLRATAERGPPRLEEMLQRR